MGYRKIIGFGDGSFVVSLPKEWVRSNGLKKGDTINLEEDSGIIRVSPITIKPSDNNSEIIVEFDGNIKKLKSEIIHAYIESYNQINVVGKKLFNHVDAIKEILDGLIALEVVQKNQEKVILKDFLNIQDISVHDTVRRIDRIVMSMADDVKSYLDGTNVKVVDIIKQKEKDVNRLTNLVFKILRRCFNPSDRGVLKLSFGDILYYWEMCLFIEKTGDQLKLLPKNLKPNVELECKKIFDDAILQYANAMKSNFTKDYNLAISVLAYKKIIYEQAEELIEKLPHGRGYGSALEKVRNINDYAGNLAKSLLRLKLERKEKQSNY